MHAGSLALASDNTTKRAVYVSSEEKLVAAEGARKMKTSLLLLILCASSCLASRLRPIKEGCEEKNDQTCTLRCCWQGLPDGNTPTVTFQRPYSTPSRNVSLLAVEKAFSTPTCIFNRPEEPDYFECYAEAPHLCQSPDYTCIVTQMGQTAKQYLKITRIAENEGYAPPPKCYAPVIKNLTTQEHTDRIITVSWLYHRNGSFKYCNGSRYFEVGYLSYTTYEEAQNERALPEVNYTSAGKRINEFNISISERSRFYRFYVRTRLGEDSSNRRTLPAVTQLQYFIPPATLEMVNGDQTFHVREGETITPSCSARSTPPPTITYEKLGTGHVRSTFDFRKVNIDDGGVYTCKACNEYFDQRSGTMQPRCTFAKINIHVIRQDKDCYSYTGQLCSEYIHSNWKVFTDNTSSLATHELMNIEPPTGFSDKCSNFIRSVFCHSRFPYCDPFTVGNGEFNPLQICNRTCKELKERCGEELNTIGDSELFKTLFSNCARDSSGNWGPGDKPGCIFVNANNPFKDGPDTDDILEQETTTGCILNNGRSYRGSVQTTEDGYPCQKWIYQSPQRHQFTDMMGGELDTASKYCRNPGGLGERPWCFIADWNIKRRWGYCDIPACESCVPYTGDFCTAAGYSNTTSVFFRRNVKDSIADMELELRGAIHMVQDSLTKGCKQALLQLLCYGALPTCIENTKSPPCEEHCQLFEYLDICPSNVRDLVKSIHYLHLRDDCSSTDPPRCDSDPRPTTEEPESGSAETCYLALDSGNSYSGDRSYTENNHPCIQWSDRRSAVFSEHRFPELQRSFCRNPSQLGKKPWCFISRDGEWEYCNVSLCDNENNIPAAVTPQEDTSSRVVIVVVSVAVLVIVLIVSAIVAFCAYNKHKRYQNKRREKTHQNLRTLRGMRDNSVYFNQTVLSPAVVEMIKSFRKVDRSKIKYLKQLGQGNFGIVFLGECEDIKTEGDEPTKVAVKTLKQESSRESTEDFVREAKLLHGFDHPNIVDFYGVSMDDMPYYMIFEYMDQGDLCQFLRIHGSSAQRRYNPPIFRNRMSSSVSNDSAILGSSQLLDMCKQVACGMAYLESKNHIHRDLACRNCLVQSGMIVKIADFGMSQNLYSRDYYRVSGEACLPVRWMPPEAVVYGKFTTKGDVWSYGIVIWEIFSFAMQPYWGLPNDAVVEMIRRGKLLEKPDACPDKVYSLVKEGCWCMHEQDRMTFAALDKALSNLRLSDSDISYSIDLETASDTVFDDMGSVSDYENDNDNEN